MSKKHDIRPYFSLILLSVGLLASPTSRAQNKSIPPDQVTKAAGIDRPFWAPNRIGTYLNNVGSLVDFRVTNSAGMEWPVGSGNTINFTSGLWLAGKKAGDIVTAIVEFDSEYRPGNVTDYAPGAPGTPADPDDPAFKVFFIKRGDSADPLANPDYLNWPKEHGAPVDSAGKPLLLGTSTAWAVFNDFDTTAHNDLIGTPPMGVEVQMTAWGFDRNDAFGNMLFYRYRFINKSGVDIDSCYVAFWADIDLGDATDLVGCDTTLSLGFQYKTQRDGLYGDNPPAIGYKLLQGPIVPAPGEVAQVSGEPIANFRNLPMTAFPHIGKGPPQWQNPETAQGVFYRLQGLDLFGDPHINPFTGRPTKYAYTGDPITGEGWLTTGHRDRQLIVCSGPFDLADGETQEAVIGIIIAQGDSGRDSVRLLKRNSRIAQRAYDAYFRLPPPPPAPHVASFPEDSAIVLTWDRVAEAYRAVDPVDPDSLGGESAYLFQGYNVYQLSAPFASAGTQRKKIATFDLKDGIVDIRDQVFIEAVGQVAEIIVQEARDSGLQRFFRVTGDYLNNLAPLIKNQPYYFAVTAYAHNPLGVPRTLESPLQVMEVRPQSPALGTQIDVPFGDSLQVTHVGRSSGRAYAIVIAPTALTGETYQITFRASDSLYTVWDITANGTLKLSGWRNQGEAGNLDYPVVDGVLVQVFGIRPGINKVIREFEGGPRWISGTNWGASHLFGGMDLGVNFFGSTVWPSDYVTVDWRFTKNPTMSEETGWMRCYVYRRDLGYAAVAERGWAPFQVFDMSDSTHPRQLNVCFVEDANGGLADLIWNPIAAEQTGGDPGGREYTFIMSSSYDPDGNIYDDDNWGPAADVLYALWPNNRGSHPYQEADFTMRIIPNFVNTERDTFTFRSEAPVRNDLALARKQAAALVNVFPNPVNRGLIQLPQAAEPFVTFTHLPERNTVIRIYSLAGDLIRTIEHDNGTQFDFWDLRNANGRAVASGVYLVYIDMGEVGVKVLKVVVL